MHRSMETLGFEIGCCLDTGNAGVYELGANDARTKERTTFTSYNT
jgi:hypothetical protein